MKASNVNVQINRQALREYRQLAGYSGAELAEAVGCSPAYISILERHDDRACSPKLFGRICDALGLEDRTILRRRDDVPARAA